MYKKNLVLCVLFFVVHLASAQNLLQTTIKGKAVSDKGSSYTEEQIVSYFDKTQKKIKEIKTEYTKDGNKFASMKTEFSESGFMPKLIFSDPRHNEFYETTVEKNKFKLKSNIEGKSKESKFDLKSNDIAGSAFHKFIYENFDRLLKESIVVRFLFPKAHDFYSLKIRKHSENKDEVTFYTQPDSFFLRMVAPKIIVKYSKKDKNLIYYKGPSNLSTDSGEAHSVEINYEQIKK